MKRFWMVLLLAGVALADPVTNAADQVLETFHTKGDLKELAESDANPVRPESGTHLTATCDP